MRGDRFFLDTSYAIARIDRRDRHHAAAQSFGPRLHAAAEVWTTEAVLVEIGNALSAVARHDAARFVKNCYKTRNFRILTIDRRMLLEGLGLYQSRPDKTWGLTDCLSFLAMGENALTDALTADKHFIQAGFRALLLEEA